MSGSGPAPFSVSVDRTGPRVVVAARGELDLATAPELETSLLPLLEAGDPVALDLRELEFMDSTGLRVIVSADGRARDEGRVLRLVRGPEAVQRIFRVTRLDERLEIGDDPDALAKSA